MKYNSEITMIYLLITILFVTLLYIQLKRANRYWLDRSVKHRKPTFLFGNSLDNVLRKKSFYSTLIDVYNDFPNERYVGMYIMRRPVLLIRDPDLIKTIAIKDFDYFVDHRELVPTGLDKTWSKTLFALKGSEWKDIRSAVSPTFTSSKMKIIFGTVTDCIDIYMDYFVKKNCPVDIDLKDTFSRFTNDVIATVAYGVRCDSINDKNNEFYVRAKRLASFDFKANMKVLAYAFASRLCKKLGMHFFDQKAVEFMNSIMSEAIKIREKNGTGRADMISLLLDERKQRKISDKTDKEKTEITYDDIASQGFIFLLAGFDTVSNLSTFVAYGLTANPDVQTKLQEEIDNVLKRNGKLTYDGLINMKYMDMVISETLRLWTPANATDRICTKSYTIQPSSPTEKPIELNPGDMVWIPTHALHRDPKYFPDPMKFDPERFSDENKDLIKPYTYQPFGIGPRVCIGARLAQMEVKALMFNLLSKFDFVRNEKTQVPMKMSTDTFDLRPEGKVWITLKPRDK